MHPVFVTTLVLISAGIVRVYDLMVSLTSGGPGIGSEMPAKYVTDKLPISQNLGKGFAAPPMKPLYVIFLREIGLFPNFRGWSSCIQSLACRS
ncbi:MAG: glucose/mannose transport system permease protein [Paracoccaceae bacterium]|jgi:glucose/mannose transport system permease protein